MSEKIPPCLNCGGLALVIYGQVRGTSESFYDQDGQHQGDNIVALQYHRYHYRNGYGPRAVVRCKDCQKIRHELSLDMDKNKIAILELIA